MSDDRPVLFDVNALVALALTTHQHHRSAHTFLASVRTWATCPVTESGLIRMLLNPVITGSQREVTEVWPILRGMRSDPRWNFLPDDSTLVEAVVSPVVLMGHRQVTDLHLVNLAASRGAVLATFDSAFHTWLAPKDRPHVVTIPA